MVFLPFLSVMTSFHDYVCVLMIPFHFGAAVARELERVAH